MGLSVTSTRHYIQPFCKSALLLCAQSFSFFLISFPILLYDLPSGRLFVVFMMVPSTSAVYVSTIVYLTSHSVSLSDIA